MNDETADHEKRKLAERVRHACLRAALDAYEQGGLAGLCEAGRWDLAMDAIRALNLQTLLERSAESEMQNVQTD